MPIQQVGKSKIKAIIRGENVLPHSRSRSGKAADMSKELTFKMEDQQLPQPTFNVLYVQTPRIGLLQGPLFRAFAQTCAEAADLVKPILRMGLRESSLFDKCPYYE